MKTYKEDNQNLLFKSIKTAYCNQRVASEIELALCVGDALPLPKKLPIFVLQRWRRPCHSPTTEVCIQ